MEKEVDKFKDTAVVVIKDKPGSNITQLLSKHPEFSSSFLPPEYRISYDLYVNGVKIDGDYLLVDGGNRILEARTYREITEEDIKKLSY